MSVSHSSSPTTEHQASIQHLNDLIAKAGVSLNGEHPYDIVVHDPKMADMVLASGSLGLGESYMAKMWDCAQIDVLLYKILSSHVDEEVKNLKTLWYSVRAKIRNHQTKSKAFEVGKAHYDAGNELFKCMLDPYMVYTCGYWRDADNLNQAQINKLDLVCQKLSLKPGMRVLDIGCGWGGFMRYAAEHYGVECVGVTISQEQVNLGQTLCAGLPIEFRLQDYRDLHDQFDAIVSLGMFEHVGHKNYQSYFETAYRNLKNHGLFLLHSIGVLSKHYYPDPWLDKYIFPNGELPNISQIADATSNLFVIEDMHNFGADYDKTLMAWHHNFEEHWPQLQAHYDETFYRMWRYYLLICAATFRTRQTQLWQFVLSKNGVPGGYQRPFV